MATTEELAAAKDFKYKTSSLSMYLNDREGFDPVNDGFHAELFKYSYLKAVRYNDVMTKHNGKPLGIEFKSKSNDQYTMITPDASEPGRYRMSFFDKQGFYSHSVHNTIEATVEEMVSDGFYSESKGILSQLQQSPEFEIGNRVSTLIGQLNMGKITHQEFCDQRQAIHEDVKERIDMLNTPVQKVEEPVKQPTYEQLAYVLRMTVPHPKSAITDEPAWTYHNAYKKLARLRELKTTWVGGAEHELKQRIDTYLEANEFNHEPNTHPLNTQVPEPSPHHKKQISDDQKHFIQYYGFLVSDNEKITSGELAKRIASTCDITLPKNALTVKNISDMDFTIEHTYKGYKITDTQTSHIESSFIATTTPQTYKFQLTVDEDFNFMLGLGTIDDKSRFTGTLKHQNCTESLFKPAEYDAKSNPNCALYYTTGNVGLNTILVSAIPITNITLVQSQEQGIASDKTTTPVTNCTPVTLSPPQTYKLQITGYEKSNQEDYMLGLGTIDDKNRFTGTLKHENCDKSLLETPSLNAKSDPTCAWDNANFYYGVGTISVTDLPVTNITLVQQQQYIPQKPYPALTPTESKELTTFTATIQQHYPNADQKNLTNLCIIASDMQKLTIQNAKGTLSDEKHTSLTDKLEKQVKIIVSKDLPHALPSFPYIDNAPAIKLYIAQGQICNVPEIPKNKLDLTSTPTKPPKLAINRPAPRFT